MRHAGRMAGIVVLVGLVAVSGGSGCGGDSGATGDSGVDAGTDVGTSDGPAGDGVCTSAADCPGVYVSSNRASAAIRWRISVALPTAVLARCVSSTGA